MLYVNPMDARVDALSQQSKAGVRANGAADPAREKKALKEYEHFFLFQLLREMRKTVPKDGYFKKSNEQDYMEEMLDDNYAGIMTDSGQFGIAKQMEHQMHAAKRVEDYKAIPLRPLSPSVHGLIRTNTDHF